MRVARFSRRHVLTAAVPLALASCGDAGGGGSTSGSGGEKGGAGSGGPGLSMPGFGRTVGGGTKTPITVGATASLTGTASKGAQHHKQAYELWAEHATERGLLGRPVTVTVLDDANDPVNATQLYEKLAAVDKVNLILGPFGSTVTRAASTATERLKYPMLVTGTSDSDLWKRKYRYLFGVYSVAESRFHGVIDLAMANGLRRVAIVNESSAVPNAIASGALAHTRSKGMEVVFQERYPLRTKDLAPLLGRLKAATPEVVLAGTYPAEAALLARQIRELDVNVRLLAFSMGGNDAEFHSAVGAAADYALAPSIWEPDIKTPGNAEFVDAYRKRWGADPDVNAASAYAGAQALEAAVKKANALDREKVREALATLDTTTILPGRYKVDETGVQTGHTPVIVQWQGDQKVLVAPESLATGQPKLPAPD